MFQLQHIFSIKQKIHNSDIYIHFTCFLFVNINQGHNFSLLYKSIGCLCVLIKSISFFVNKIPFRRGLNAYVIGTTVRRKGSNITVSFVLLSIKLLNILFQKHIDYKKDMSQLEKNCIVKYYHNLNILGRIFKSFLFLCLL